MSLKTAAFNLFKKVWKSPNRDEVRAVLKRVKPGTFGVGNKLYPAPVLGLLLYNQHRVKAFLNRDFVSELSSWNERDLKILFGVHNQIRRLNEQCLAPLAGELPEAINGINPYKEFPQTVSTDGFEELLFSNEDASEVIKLFHTHPAFDIALRTLPTLKKARHSFVYDQTIPGTISQLDEAGPGGTIEWYEHFEDARRVKHHQLYVYEHVGALLSLYSSLSTLSQLLYQGLYQDELLHLTLNHIIHYGMTTAGPGPSMWLMHRPYEMLIISEEKDLIFISTDKPGEQGRLKELLCYIHYRPLSFDFASPGKLTLRVIDDYLNVYRYLLK
jgi:hypothetical protein